MEKEEIRKRVERMKNKEDLLLLLNDIKVDEFRNKRKEEIRKRVKRMKNKKDLLLLMDYIKSDEICNKSHPFTMGQISFYCNPNSIPNSKRYYEFFIAKKSGGQRHISAPVNDLKDIQTCLNIIFKAIYEPSQWAMGFTRKRSVVDNASVHVGQNYVFNLDIKDFFPSIPQARVWGRLKVKPFCFTLEIAGVVAGLCCMKLVTDTSVRYVLPQGAPTSPLLTNAICDKLDYKLSRLAQHYGLKYSRYADDITFSSKHNVYQKNSRFMKSLFAIIQEQGFQVNEAKTRLQKKGSRQEVTGLIVSDKVNVTRKYIEDIRNVLYIWRRYGLAAAKYRFAIHYRKEKGHVKEYVPPLEYVIEGKLSYLKMVKGEDDSTYQKLRNQYDKLMGNPIVNKNEATISFLQSRAADFCEYICNSSTSDMDYPF